MKRKSIFGLILTALIALIGGSYPIVEVAALPSQMYLYENQAVSYDILYPFSAEKTEGENLKAQTTYYTAGDSRLTLSSSVTGSAKVDIKMFGALTVKSIQVNVIPEKYLIPGGNSIGIAIRADGALVVGRDKIVTPEGKTVCPAADAGLSEGDLIIRINGENVKNAEHMIKLINSLSGKPISVVYIRGDKEYTTTVYPAMDKKSRAYRFGIWVRDSSAGIGTMTYYDPATKKYAALGHPICDGSTGSIVSVRSGELLGCSIIDIVKGQKGKPGELRGVLDTFNGPLGTITRNCDYGVYGAMNTPPINSLYPNGLPAGSRDGVHVGKCSILCSVDSEGMREYEAMIVSCERQDRQDTKSMVIRITDAELLKKTGGIVQGMSGSPIIQDGKIIGAVTHVFVNDPTCGYGIYIDWMLCQTQ